jgi:hypothetical protein
MIIDYLEPLRLCGLYVPTGARRKLGVENDFPCFLDRGLGQRLLG